MARPTKFTTVLVMFSVMAGFIAGCGSSPPPQSFNPAGDPTTLVEQYLTIKKADKLKGIKKVVIPQFMVQFVTRNAGAASASSAASKQTSVHVTYNLTNVDNAQFQAIADKMYEQVVEEFTKAGIEVVPVSTYQQAKPFQKLLNSAKKAPFTVTEMDRTSVYFGAKGLPVYFSMNDKRQGLGNMFAAQFTNFNPDKWEERIGEENDCAVLIVNYGVAFASMDTSGGWWKDRASVKTKLKIALLPEDTKYIVYSKNGTTRFTLKEPVFADGNFIIDVTDALRTDEKVANAIGGALGSGSRTVKYNANADAAAYTSLVEKHMTAIDSLIFGQMKANL